MNTRLPIFHDDFTFNDHQSNLFDDMRRQMGSPFSRTGAGSPFNDPMNRFRDDFFQLKPHDPMSRLMRSDDAHSSRESLDENSLKSLFIEDPNTKSRLFQISFDVKDYDPNKVSVQVQNGQLLVEAKSEKERDGNKLINEFNRKVQIPKEVDADKLTSKLSSDGILTISAPVPPKYQSITNGSDKSQDRDSPKGMTSPIITQTKGRNSPSVPMYQGRNSPTIVTNTSTSPVYKKQIYMVPSQVRSPTISQQMQQSSPPLYQQDAGVPVAVRNTARARTPPLDTPTFYNTERGCEMILIMDIGLPYTPEDLLVKVDGRTLTVEAEHVENQNGRKSKSCISREFALNQPVNPSTVAALLKEGRLKVTGLAQ